MSASKKSFGPEDLGPTVRDRFLKYVDHGEEQECWEWLGSIHVTGYGRFNLGTKQNSTYAHRVAVALDERIIPAGMVVDHMCHNKECVNPQHLQVVTQWQNIQYRITRDNTQYRGGPKSLSKDKTRCGNGHAWTEENTYLHTNKKGRTNRYCRACQRIRTNNYYKKAREMRNA